MVAVLEEKRWVELWDHSLCLVVWALGLVRRNNISRKISVKNKIITFIVRSIFGHEKTMDEPTEFHIECVLSLVAL